MGKKTTLIFLSSFTITIFSSWGFFAHQRINKVAVYLLPKELIGFYKNNINYISLHAVDPDKRRYADTSEAAKHYLDADHYGKHPFDSIPQKWNDAINKFSKDTILAYGIVPWQIEKTYKQLVNAYTLQDSTLILKYSADLGHYIADAHVPLHTTENYNGQLTNQVGIHAFWESRLPELFSSDYNFLIGKAEYIDKPLKEAWRIVRESHSKLDSTLIIERNINNAFPSDKKFGFGLRNQSVVKEYTFEYSNAYHQALNGMVEKQMRAAILSVASYWYSAWIDGGQPDMKKLIYKGLSEIEKKELEKVEHSYQSGKMLGRPEN